MLLTTEEMQRWTGIAEEQIKIDTEEEMSWRKWAGGGTEDSVQLCVNVT